MDAPVVDKVPCRVLFCTLVPHHVQLAPFLFFFAHAPQTTWVHHCLSGWNEFLVSAHVHLDVSFQEEQTRRGSEPRFVCDRYNLDILKDLTIVERLHGWKARNNKLFKHEFEEMNEAWIHRTRNANMVTRTRCGSIEKIALTGEANESMNG